MKVWIEQISKGHPEGKRSGEYVREPRRNDIEIDQALVMLLLDESNEDLWLTTGTITNRKLQRVIVMWHRFVVMTSEIRLLLDVATPELDEEICEQIQARHKGSYVTWAIENGVWP